MKRDNRTSGQNSKNDDKKILRSLLVSSVNYFSDLSQVIVYDLSKLYQILIFIGKLFFIF